MLSLSIVLIIYAVGTSIFHINNHRILMKTVESIPQHIKRRSLQKSQHPNPKSADSQHSITLENWHRMTYYDRTHNCKSFREIETSSPAGKHDFSYVRRSSSSACGLARQKAAHQMRVITVNLDDLDQPMACNHRGHRHRGVLLPWMMMVVGENGRIVA